MFDWIENERNQDRERLRVVEAPAQGRVESGGAMRSDVVAAASRMSGECQRLRRRGAARHRRTRATRLRGGC
jgi:hypothetical protein